MDTSRGGGVEAQKGNDHKPWYIGTCKNGRRQWFFVEDTEIAAAIAKELGYNLARGIEGPFATRRECEERGAS